MSPVIFAQHVTLALVAIGIAIGYLALAAANKAFEYVVEKLEERSEASS